MKLTNVPVDVQEAIIKRQDKEIELCDCERAQEYAIYKIIREHTKQNESVSTLLWNGYHVPVEPNVYLEGNEFVINLTVKVPITTPMGMMLNYERIDK